MKVLQPDTDGFCYDYPAKIELANDERLEIFSSTKGIPNVPGGKPLCILNVHGAGGNHFGAGYGSVILTLTFYEGEVKPEMITNSSNLVSILCKPCKTGEDQNAKKNS